MTYSSGQYATSTIYVCHSQWEAERDVRKERQTAAVVVGNIFRGNPVVGELISDHFVESMSLIGKGFEESGTSRARTTEDDCH